ncbi:MAG: PKD domain-containing protein, partial [Anaerolineae bacterium]|nr:PKD domain-containing protein [Anaerolineae bacterium]
CGYSGTSMASPHSAGAVALLWSCNPSLIGQMDMTFEALQNTADPAPAGNCGAPPDGEGNYTYGYGYLNVYQAGLIWCGDVELGWLDGYVYDDATGNPIEGASVTAVPGYGIQAVTDPTGYYTMTLVPGTYDVTASKYAYYPQTVTGVVVVTDTVTSQDFSLVYQGGWSFGPSTSPFEYNRFDGVFNPVDGLIYFPGGRTGGSTHDRSIWTYDPLNDVWANTGCDLLENAANITAVLIDDDGTGRGEAIYVVGGYDAVAAVNIDDVQRYYPSQSGCVVERVTTDPYPDASPAGYVVGAGGVAEVDGKIYVFGGWESTTPWFSNRTWEFDPLAAGGSRWTQISGATLSPARSYLQVAVQDGLIYAMGGADAYTGGDITVVNIVEVFDPANPGAGWQSMANMPVALAEGRGFGFDSDTMGIQAPWSGKIYVVGGGDWPEESAEAMEYDVASDTWDQSFPNLNTMRRDHAGVFVPLCTPDPSDGLPGMWVFGGRSGSDEPPYADPEFFPFPCDIDQPELSITKTVAMPYAMAGDPVTYTIGYANDGDGNAMGAVITDVLPMEVVYVSDDAGGTYDPVAHEVVWSMDVYSHTSGMIELVVEVSTTVPADTVVVNDAYLAWEDESYHASASFLVVGPPEADFMVAGAPGCEPLTVSFTDMSSGDPTEWMWDLGDGTTSTETNPVHVYMSDGVFTVTLVVTNAYGCDSAWDTVEVYDTPTPEFSWTPSMIYTDTMVQFSDDTMGDVVEWLWDTGDGYTYVISNPTHTYLMTGTYTVTLHITTAMGCSNVAWEELVVYEQGVEPPLNYVYLPIVLKEN